MQTILSDRFELAESPPRLADNEIHLWRLVLDAALNPREITTAAHAFLCRQLMHYAGVSEPPTIARSDRGKPYAPALPGIDFNLSHARDHVLIAFARHQAVGVDLERIDRRIEAGDLARRFFSAAEADALEALPAGARAYAFLRLWTCKEAVLKALGAGITFGLDRIAFELDTDGEPAGIARFVAAAGAREQWQVVRLDPAPGFLGALAWRGAPRSIRTFRADANA